MRVDRGPTLCSRDEGVPICLIRYRIHSMSFIYEQRFTREDEVHMFDRHEKKHTLNPPWSSCTRVVILGRGVPSPVITTRHGQTRLHLAGQGQSGRRCFSFSLAE